MLKYWFYHDYLARIGKFYPSGIVSFSEPRTARWI
jgi:hypothetical protein